MATVGQEQSKALAGVAGSWGAVAWSFYDPLYSFLQIAALVGAIVASYATARYYFKKRKDESSKDSE